MRRMSLSHVLKGLVFIYVLHLEGHYQVNSERWNMGKPNMIVENIISSNIISPLKQDEVF